MSKLTNSGLGYVDDKICRGTDLTVSYILLVLASIFRSLPIPGHIEMLSIELTQSCLTYFSQ